MRFVIALSAIALTAALPNSKTGEPDGTALLLGRVAIVTLPQPDVCQAKIGALRSATTAVLIAGKNAEKDRAGLLGKLDNASSALTAGKNSDAIQKLDDFVAKVMQLRDAGKIASADAESLIAGANDAIGCIQQLG
jgi:hypothetical protein